MPEIRPVANFFPHLTPHHQPVATIQRKNSLPAQSEPVAMTEAVQAMRVPRKKGSAGPFPGALSLNVTLIGKAAGARGPRQRHRVMSYHRTRRGGVLAGRPDERQQYGPLVRRTAPFPALVQLPAAQLPELQIVPEL